MRIDKRKGLISGFGFCKNVLRGRESLWSLWMGRRVIVFNKTCTNATFSISIQIDKLKSNLKSKQIFLQLFSINFLVVRF